MKMVGYVDIRIRVRFNQDISEDDVDEFVKEMDYTITDGTGKVSVADTEVMESEVPDNDETLGIG